MTEFTTCQSSKDLLVTYLYDEVTPEERAEVEAHLAACVSCREEVETLTSVRTALTEWEAPALASHFRIVSEADRPARRHLTWWRAGPLAAAAVLVLAVGAAVANLEVQFSDQGMVVRTGWAPRASQAPIPTTAARQPSESSGVATAAPAAGVSTFQRQVAFADNDAPWRADFARLADELRREMATSAARPTAVSTRTSDDELLRRVQQMIDDSELRQQRNLALRVTELSRDFALQRQTDLVQIQQGLGRLEGRTEAEAARSRQLINMMRVSQQQEPR